MNGNNPCADVPGVTGADQASADRELTVDQMNALRRAVTGIVPRMESCLPEGFAVGSELSAGANGSLATVAIHPSVGHPVSAGFSPDTDDLDTGLIDEGRNEVARGLVASAAFQVMGATGDDLIPAAW